MLQMKFDPDAERPFSFDAERPLSAAALLTADETTAVLPAGAVLMVGSGATAVAAVAARPDVECALPDFQPHAQTLALLAQRLPALDCVTPLYLRAADAKPSSAPPLSRRPGP